jgi:AcrR family transcriptional regulator
VTPKANTPRQPLTKERILQAAVDVADQDGLGALTMRRLGTELGFEAMAIYKHVANKEEILEGMLELVVGQIQIPEEGDDWRDAMRRRAVSAREVFSRHSWAIALQEAGTATGSTTMRYRNAILGNLRSAGFPMEYVAHAFSLLDSYVYGQVIQEISLSFDTSEEATEAARSTLEQTTMDDYPHLAAMYEHAVTYDYSFDGEFEFGLDLILDGLERHRATRRPSQS